ncbi:MAG: structural protein P5 [Proteobacteria bacterium]|nr:structural protein P5 [Pseudomonadota bacterium]
MPKNLSRGIRNNNPGNIRLSKDKWQGLAAQQTDAEFFVFENPVYGIRAIARILIKYQDDYGLRTIGAIIGRWAPTSENNTDAYIKRVVERSGFAADQELDMHQQQYLMPLVKAIIWHENAQQPYSDEQINKALVLAGVESTPKPLAKTPTMQGAKITASAGAVAAASGVIAEAAPAIPVLQALSDMVKDNALGFLIVLGVLVIFAAGYIAWARAEDRRRGLV